VQKELRPVSSVCGYSREYPGEDDKRTLHKKRRRKTCCNPPSGPNPGVLEIPKDQILRRPQCEEGDERSERLIGTTPRIGYKHVEAEQN
jgi:hypothetical protein